MLNDEKSLDQSKEFNGEFTGQRTMTVFNDHGNPLLSQVAIFARLLEQLKADKRGSDNGQAKADKADEGESDQPEATKRTTRGA